MKMSPKITDVILKFYLPVYFYPHVYTELFDVVSELRKILETNKFGKNTIQNYSKKIYLLGGVVEVVVEVVVVIISVVVGSVGSVVKVVVSIVIVVIGANVVESCIRDRQVEAIG